MLRIRRFGIIQTSTVAAVLYGLSVLVLFAVLAVIAVFVGGFPGGGVIPGGELGAMTGATGLLIAGVVLAIGYAIGGWIITAITCAIYNLVAGWTGGIELQIEQVAPPAQPTWSATPPPPPPANPYPPAAPAP